MSVPEVSYLYEEPSSLHPADWERFCTDLQAEVDQHPERHEARVTLAFARRMLRALRRDPLEGPREETARAA